MYGSYAYAHTHAALCGFATLIVQKLCDLLANLPVVRGLRLFAEAAAAPRTETTPLILQRAECATVDAQISRARAEFLWELRHREISHPAIVGLRRWLDPTGSRVLWEVGFRMVQA